MKPDIAAYLESWGAELQARKDRVRQLIGSAHWLTDGHHKEAILRDFLIRYLPNECECSTGFVRSVNDQEGCSPEIDILLFNRRMHLPYFCEGGVSIIDPASMLATIEVKSNFSKETLDDAIENVKKVRSVAMGRTLTLPNLWSGIIFYEMPVTRDLESAISTLGEVLKTHFPLNESSHCLPTCLILGNNFLAFPRVVGGKIKISAFNGCGRAFACGFCDLFAAIAPQLGGLALSGFEEWGSSGSFTRLEKFVE
ncbi:DUF6602 domain-containing protein [Undibacterium pigrum]|uniref:DUF6602 domain-containing protein n=1 Tax=Undibacterium pigrum TaxID=401470 RepID=A0A318JEJ0_9BURK|nr:DUF6602 domain-containing protein [Undibacterium pigrum]PXX46976.1 hypothetical protein DFR42_101552 [Undibacterium pigrum]